MSKMFPTHNKLLKYHLFQQIDIDIWTVFFDTANDDNPLTIQGLKMGVKIYRLIFFEKSPSNLTYEFEKGVIMKFYHDNKKVLINLHNPKLKINYIKEWSFPQKIEWKNEYKELNYINVLLTLDKHNDEKN